MKLETIAKNQVFATLESGTRFFSSYGTNIVKIEENKVYLDEKFWNYSKTTGKYRNIFLGEDKTLTQKRIDLGEYSLVNLNEGKI